MHIIFVASEAAPLVKTGGLADVVGSLPREMAALGHEVRICIPYYRQLIDSDAIAIRHLGDMRIWLDGAERLVPVHEAAVDGLQFLLIEQDELYDRPHLYGPPGGEFSDNPLRFGLLCRAALAAAIDLIGPVDVYHCHDWQAG
ncbi:MAG: glycogen/starch synthase, partial [Mariprofundaceae bacterium]